MTQTSRSPVAHGFFRVAACTPRVAVADPRANLEATLALAQLASRRGAGLAVFPELALSAYSNDDLFFQDALLDAVEDALREACRVSAELLPILVVGAPLRTEGKLFNCAVVLHRGQILCVVPRTYVPNYREFYEKRYFASAAAGRRSTIRIDDRDIPFGNDVLIEWRHFAGDGTMTSDLITPAGERRDGVPLLVPVMRAGKRVGTPSSLAQIRKHAKGELAQLPHRLATLESMTYPVEIDPALQRLARECDQRIAEMQSRS